jgi:hypothetical protein
MSGLPRCEHKRTYTRAFIPHNLPREAPLAGSIVIVHEDPHEASDEPQGEQEGKRESLEEDYPPGVVYVPEGVGQVPNEENPSDTEEHAVA